jgi:hypothetical protein
MTATQRACPMAAFSGFIETAIKVGTYFIFVLFGMVQAYMDHFVTPQKRTYDKYD